MEGADSHDELLVPVLAGGQRVAPDVPLEESRARALESVGRLPEELKRLEAPAEYPVGLERSLHALKRALIEEAREPAGEA